MDPLLTTLDPAGRRVCSGTGGSCAAQVVENQCRSYFPFELLTRRQPTGPFCLRGRLGNSVKSPQLVLGLWIHWEK